jgi:hypothetical protein
VRLLDGNLLVSQSRIQGRTSRHKRGYAVASSKQRAVTDVPLEGWVRFGRILREWREDVLGYKTRAAFVRDSGINLRLAQELENSPAYRAGTYTKWALEDAEKAYQVTRESMLAVLHGEADTLARAAAVSPEKLAAVDPLELPPSPFGDPVRDAADRPYAEAIWKRFLDLPKNVTEPSGRQMFPGDPDDEKAWDAPGPRLPLGDRVWLVADLRRWAAGRDDNSDTGVTGA